MTADSGQRYVQINIVRLSQFLSTMYEEDFSLVTNRAESQSHFDRQSFRNWQFARIQDRIISGGAFPMNFLDAPLPEDLSLFVNAAKTSVLVFDHNTAAPVLTDPTLGRFDRWFPPTPDELQAEPPAPTANQIKEMIERRAAAASSKKYARTRR